MLIHVAVGPLENGRYLVAYLTPGCSVLTVAGDCRTQAGATAEADRLNLIQIEREKAIQAERAARINDYQGAH
jgi:hypothetical protein